MWFAPPPRSPNQDVGTRETLKGRRTAAIVVWFERVVRLTRSTSEGSSGPGLPSRHFDLETLQGLG